MSSACAAWRERTPLPLPRAGAVVGLVNQQLIVAGGSYWRDGRKQFTTQVDRYDPKHDVWMTAPPMPNPLADSACCAVDGRIFVFGGGVDGIPTGRTIRREPSGEWADHAAMELPAPRRSVQGCEIGGEIFLLGGFCGDNLGTATNSLWSAPFDGKWITRKPIPGPVRFSPAVANVGNNILVAGGACLVGDEVRNLADVWSYDPTADEWREIARLPSPRRAAAAFAKGSQLIVLGGFSTDFLAEVVAVDPRTGICKRSGMLPSPIADARVGPAGGKFFLSTGECGFRKRAPWLWELHQ